MAIGKLREEIEGVRSIVPGPDRLDSEVPFPYRVALLGPRVLRKWVELGLAFIPYCITCRVPLNWIYNDERELFRCPKCGRLWIKGEDWPTRG